MSTREGQSNHPGRLAEVLAELHLRLRLSHSGSARPPAALDRLLVTTTLLPELSARDEGFATLARSLDRLVAAVEAEPALWPDHLDEPLGALAEFLEGVLTAADEGHPDLGEEDGWRRQLRVWSVAYTPAEIFGELTGSLARWQKRWPDGPAGLETGWAAFRNLGDRLFGVAEPGAAQAAHGIEGGLVIVVVDGELRRDQVRARVRAAGFEAVSADIGDVHALSEEAGAVGILADDLEPRRNLARLARGANPAGRRCPLVLLSAGNCDPAAERDRAVRSGADGAWCEPWDPVVLLRILQHPSHP